MTKVGDEVGSFVGYRMPQFTDLPAGPMRELVTALHDLHKASGLPSPRAIGEKVKSRDDLPDCVSHETVRIMMCGSRLVRWSKFECVVRVLADRCPDPGIDQAQSVRRFLALWLAAAQDSSSTDNPAYPESPDATTAITHDTRRPPPPLHPSREHVPQARAYRDPVSSAVRSPGVITNIGTRNGNLIWREMLLTEMDQAISRSPRLPLVLSGPGGVGKSQLARDYAQRYRHQFDLVWLISAEEDFGARETLVEIASRLGLRSGFDRERIAQRVIQKLEQGDLSWLLIYDNALPGGLLSLPDLGERGAVIITTRSPQWPSAPARLLSVDVFDRKDSIDYLCGSDPEISRREADALAGVLGDLPLALAQLVATRTSTGMPLSRYRALFEQHLQELVNTGRAPRYRASLGATVTLAIQHAGGATLRIIELFAQLGPEPIARAVLRNGRHGIGLDDVLRRCLDDSEQLQQCLDQTARLGLIKVEEDGQHAVAHRLVQVALRKSLDETSVARGRSNTHVLLAAANPGDPDDRSNWPNLALLTPHVLPAGMVTADHADARQAVFDQIRFLYLIGDYARSKAFADAALERWRMPPDQGGLGETHELTLRTMRALANAARALGRFAEARQLNESVLTGFIRSLEHGPDHRYTLEARTSQGTDLRLCGDYEVALGLEKENCDRHRRVWGHADVRTLKVVNNLGEGLRITGRYLEAKRMHRFTVWERSRQLGPDDIWTNFARMNLAWDLLCLGRYDDARVELETVRSRVVDTGVRPSHQLVLFADRAFAIVLRKQGQYDRSCDEAAANYRECHEFLGAANEATFSSGITYVNSLAAVDRIDDAADLAAEVRQSVSSALGPENPMTLVASVNSAIVLRRQQRRLYEAAELAHHAHAQLNRRLGPDHPYTIAAANSVATDLFLSGSYRQAGEVSAVALQHAKRRYLPRHPDRLVLTINAGLDLLAAGDQSAGNALRQPALDALAEVIGPTHPAVEQFRASQRRDWEVEPPPL